MEQKNLLLSLCPRIPSHMKYRLYSICEADRGPLVGGTVEKDKMRSNVYSISAKYSIVGDRKKLYLEKLSIELFQECQ